LIQHRKNNEKWLIGLMIAFITWRSLVAGYLGAQSGRAETGETPAPPTTIAVTRGDVQQT